MGLHYNNEIQTRSVIVMIHRCAVGLDGRANAMGIIDHSDW